MPESLFRDTAVAMLVMIWMNRPRPWIPVPPCTRTEAPPLTRPSLEPVSRSPPDADGLPRSGAD